MDKLELSQDAPNLGDADNAASSYPRKSVKPMQPAELLPYLGSALVIIPLLPVIALIAVAWYQLRNL